MSSARMHVRIRAVSLCATLARPTAPSTRRSAVIRAAEVKAEIWKVQHVNIIYMRMLIDMANINPVRNAGAVNAHVLDARAIVVSAASSKENHELIL